MRLLKFSKEQDGSVYFVVKLQTAEDVWHLYNLIEVGDEVRASTYRKVSKETASGVVSEKRHLTLSLRATHVVYDNEGGYLRVSGQNRTMSDYISLGQMHAHQIGYDPPVDVGISKASWDTVHQERLSLACDDTATAEVAAVLCCAGQANYFLVHGTMTSLKQRLRINISKKKKASGTARDESLLRFYAGVLDMMVAQTNLDAVKVILFGAPQNLREEFLRFFATRAQRDDCPPGIKALWQARSKLLPVDTSSTMSLREIMAVPAVQEKLASTAQAEDVRLWEEFHSLINTMPAKVTYGTQIVFAAHTKHAAIDKLLVSDEAIRGGTGQQRAFLTEFIDEVREQGGSANVFSSRTHVGEQLHMMGGCAAILRIPLEDFEDKVHIVPDFCNSKEAAEFLNHRAQAAKMRRNKSGSGSSGGANNDDDDG